MDYKQAMQAAVHLNRIGEQLRNEKDFFNAELVNLAIDRFEETIKHYNLTSGIKNVSNDELVNQLQQTFASYFIKSGGTTSDLLLVKMKTLIDELSTRFHQYTHSKGETFNDEAFNTK